MDDIVITRSDSKSILSVKSFLHSQFHTTDLRMLKYFLGVEVMRSKQKILLSQWKYVLDMLFETGKLGAKPCSTPMALMFNSLRKENYLKILRDIED